MRRTKWISALYIGTWSQNPLTIATYHLIVDLLGKTKRTYYEKKLVVEMRNPTLL
jgi:hypothetical protein